MEDTGHGGRRHVSLTRDKAAECNMAVCVCERERERGVAAAAEQALARLSEEIGSFPVGVRCPGLSLQHTGLTHTHTHTHTHTTVFVLMVLTTQRCCPLGSWPELRSAPLEGAVNKGPLSGGNLLWPRVRLGKSRARRQGIRRTRACEAKKTEEKKEEKKPVKSLRPKHDPGRADCGLLLQ